MPKETLVYGVTYHGSVAEPLDGLDNLYGKHISAESLREHLRWYQERFHLTSLGEVLAKARKGEEIEKNSLFIVFHDGYKDNYEVAFPLLQEFGTTASFFLTTNFIGTDERFWVDVLDAAVKYSSKPAIAINGETGVQQAPLGTDQERYDAAIKLRKVLKPLASDIFDDRFYGILNDLGYGSSSEVPRLGDHEACMNWHMVRKMVAGGMEMGSHTHRHIICARQDAETAAEEMRTSKQLIEQETGQPCDLFCYPNGYYPRDGNEETDRLAHEAGYKNTLYMVGPYNLIRPDTFKLTAIAFGERSDLAELERSLSSWRYLMRRLKRSQIWPWEHDRLE